MKAILAAILVLTIGVTEAIAQSSATATLGTTYASMRDSGTVAAPQRDVAGAAGFEHLFRHERLRVYYDVDGGTYQGTGDWSYWLHTAGLTYVWGRDGDRDRRVYLNASATLRKNGSAWAAADYAATGVGINVEGHPGDRLTTRAGYRIDRRSFVDTAALTHVEHGAFASVLMNFETRTTLIGELRLGAKSYSGRVSGSSMLLPTSGLLGTTLGSGRGMGPGLRMAPLAVVTSQSENGVAGLATGILRLAQSISDRTGLFVQASYRGTLGDVPPGLVTTPAGFADDGVYDDPFASRSTSVQFGVNAEWASGAQLRGSGSWSDRRYTSTPAVDASWLELPGAPLRTDRVWRGAAIWSQPLFTSRANGWSVSADTGYRFTRSRSNDAFYNYTSHGVGLSLSVRY